MTLVTYIDHMGSDLSVVNAARVSFGKSSSFDGRVGGPNVLKKSDARLIKYLATHKHTSPFGHAFASFHIKTPLFVHAQCVKHKFLRSNTVSRRYVDATPEFYEPEEWRGRSADKKQGSEGSVCLSVFRSNCLKSAAGSALKIYEELLEDGVSPEMARMVLPQSMLTEFFWSGSLDAWADMCVLRLAEDSQYETRVVAKQISTKMSELFPVSWEALVNER
jgi:thymidylate synthase (FAD)|tara:strand:+ start:635 stop:1294 length:660 start_codon:yes stop_codon:yes gene_type:complete